MNLAAIVEGHPEEALALRDHGAILTYGQLRSRVGSLRASLRGLGVEAGDRVAIAIANDSLFVVSYLAVLGVAAVAVPLNPDSPPAELEAQLAAVDVKLTIAAPSGADAARAIDRSGQVVEGLLVRPNGGSAADRPAVPSGAAPVAVVERAEGDLAVLMFTAGTAGAPKAAALSHGNLLANLEQVQRHPGRALNTRDVVLGVLPMFHIFGLNVMLGLSLYAGASLALVQRFDPSSTLETARAQGVTVVAGAPPMFSAWADLPGARGDELASVRLAISGAAALPAEVADSFERRFGLTLWQGYGLTEASPVVTSPVVGRDHKPGSVGVPLPGVEVRLVDVDGEDALEGDPGEIWVRGANVFTGYWQDPAATAAVLTSDGWLRTGDIAVADGEGYLWLVDRSKDLVIVSGFNVYPAEVEAVLLEHPGVAEAAVVGAPDPRTGEAVVAYVVAEGGHRLSVDEVISWCATRLARYKCPAVVETVDALPHGLAGKLLRRALRPSL